MESGSYAVGAGDSGGFFFWVVVGIVGSGGGSCIVVDALGPLYVCVSCSNPG